MKVLISAFLLTGFLFTGALPAQDNCYQGLLQEGRQLLRARSYAAAIKKFMTARSCPDKPALDQLDNQIQATIDQWVAELQRARREAEEAKNEAISEKERATQAEQAARKAEKSADSLRRIAVSQLEEILKQKQDIKQQTAQSLAKSALQENRDATLKGLLALQSYRFDPTNHQDQNIYQALFEALRKLQPSYQFLSGNPSGIFDMKFSEDQQQLFTLNSRELHVWKTNEHTYTYAKTAEELGGRILDVTRDGQFVLVEPSFGKISLLPLSEYESGSRAFPHTKGKVRAVALKTKGDMLALAFQDSWVRILNKHASTWTDSVLISERTRILKFNPQETHIAIVGELGAVWIWDLSSKKLSKPQQDLQVESLAFSPDGSSLALGTKKGELYIYNLSTTKMSPPFSTPHTDRINTLAFSSDGNWLASGSWDRAVKVWAVKQPQATPLEFRDVFWIESLDFHPDNAFLLVGYRDGSLIQWPLSTQSLAQDLCEILPAERKQLTSEEWAAFIGESSLKYEDHRIICSDEQ